MDHVKTGLENCHPLKSANLIAGLLVDPKFNANTFRIETLIHYVLINCTGVQRPSYKKIRSWLNDFTPISSAANMEDPVEDVFVTSVMTEKGDFRLYGGIWEANDFCLQKVLDTINSIPPSYDLNSLFKPI